MDNREAQKLLAEINVIKQELDRSNSTDIHYIPPYIKDLRNYVFQIHAAYEQGMQIIILVYYLARKNTENHFSLLEEISFEGKMRLVEPKDPLFPIKYAKQINHIRNEFAHKSGTQLRIKYNDPARLKLFKYLKKSNQKLNDYWYRTAFGSSFVS